MFACDVGDIVYIQNTFSNSAGAAVDPTEVFLWWTLPSGSVGTYTYSAGDVQKLATGTYYYNGTVADGGHHTVRWQGSGAAVAAEMARFFARGTT